jgi:hypothetical protein
MGQSVGCPKLKDPGLREKWGSYFQRISENL